MIRPVDSTSHKPSRVLKTVAKTAVVAGAATGAVLYLASKGKLNQTSKDTMLTSQVKGYLNNYAKQVKKGLNFVHTLFDSARIKVLDKFNKLEAAKFTNKFNPENADVLEKAAETFNNFVK